MIDSLKFFYHDVGPPPAPKSSSTALVKVQPDRRSPSNFVASFPNLQVLYLSNNLLSFSAFEYLSRARVPPMTRLTDLSLNGNRLTGLPKNFLGYWVPGVEILDLGENRMELGDATIAEVVAQVLLSEAADPVGAHV